MSYGKTNVNKAQEELDRVRRSEQGVWKPKDGDNLIRIMPPWDENVDTFFVQGGAHFNVGPQGKVFSCPRQSDNSAECYLCDLVDQLGSGDEADREEAKDLRVRRSWMVNVVDLKDPGAGVKVWKAGVKAFKQLLEYIEDPDYGDITDPETGYNIKVMKSGKDLNTEYTIRCAKNPSAFEHTDLLDALIDLSTFLNYEPEATMAAAYNGVDAPDEDEETAPVAEEAFDGDEAAPPGFEEEETEEAVSETAEEFDEAVVGAEEPAPTTPTRRPAPPVARPTAPRPPAPVGTTRPIKPAARPIPPKPPAAGAAVRRALRPAPRK
jgi:hypothetical protein